MIQQSYLWVSIQKNQKSRFWREICTLMIIVALSSIAKINNLSVHQHGWIKKMYTVHTVHTMGLRFSLIKKENLQYVTTWMNLLNIYWELFMCSDCFRCRGLYTERERQNPCPYRIYHPGAETMIRQAKKYIWSQVMISAVTKTEQAIWQRTNARCRRHDYVIRES